MKLTKTFSWPVLPGETGKMELMTLNLHIY